MRSSTTRLIIFFTTILISVIIGFQLHWLNKTFSFEKNEFNNSVTKSIRGLYEDLELENEPGFQMANLLEHPSDNVFIFKVDDAPEKDTLMNALMSEFDDFKVYAGCKVAVYDDSTRTYLYEQYITNAASFHSDPVKIDAPKLDRNYAYVYLDFPNRDKYILGNMGSWIMTSILLLLLLIALGASIYYLFRQKFLNDIQKDFINNVTHEFSTPLAVIDLSTDALKKPGISTQPDRYDKYLASIKFQTEYLKKHIQTLIKTVVTDNYQFSLEKKEMNPNEMIRKVIQQLEPVIQQQHGTVLTELEDTNTSIMADYDNLYLAFFNILSNAVKYADNPKVIVSTQVLQHKYIISTKDNGIGISKDDIKSIFKKFYRASNGNVHNVKGLGLGLYFTKKVIDLHHGQIEVNSLPGIGTEFKIILPIN